MTPKPSRRTSGEGLWSACKAGPRASGRTRSRKARNAAACTNGSACDVRSIKNRAHPGSFLSARISAAAFRTSGSRSSRARTKLSTTSGPSCSSRARTAAARTCGSASPAPSAKELQRQPRRTRLTPSWPPAERPGPGSRSAPPRRRGHPRTHRTTPSSMTSPQQIGDIDLHGIGRAVDLAGHAVPALVIFHVSLLPVLVDGEDVERADIDANTAALFSDALLLVDDNRSTLGLMDDRHGSGLLWGRGWRGAPCPIRVGWALASRTQNPALHCYSAAAGARMRSWW